jgi:hypothetical protein
VLATYKKKKGKKNFSFFCCLWRWHSNLNNCIRNIALWRKGVLVKKYLFCLLEEKVQTEVKVTMAVFGDFQHLFLQTIIIVFETIVMIIFQQNGFMYN